MIKKFYGGIFIDRQKLSDEGIEYPIKVEYYNKTVDKVVYLR